VTARAAAVALALAAMPAGADEPAAPPKPEAPLYATSGATPPREASKGCVARSVRPTGFAGSVIARFAVRPDGKTSDFGLLSPAPPEVGPAILLAVESCEWIPGRDAAGKVVAMWVHMPFRFR
jgi:hypothetical protein